MSYVCLCIMIVYRERSGAYMPTNSFSHIYNLQTVLDTLLPLLLWNFLGLLYTLASVPIHHLFLIPLLILHPEISISPSAVSAKLHSFLF